ncbi:hypothetical protein RB195_021938 [Necator americanus]|uniref:Reverse transcriptase domain-containing protein n=1 Tax=Necator americanus TaxID=51031 RepID=A0ABR1ED99_NECAM
MATKEEDKIGRFGLGNRNKNGNRLAGLLSPPSWELSSHEERSSSVSVVPSFCIGSDHRLLRAKIRLSHTTEKNICYRQRRRKEVVYDCLLEDSLPQGDWHIEEDLNVDYEILLGGLRACAERTSKPRTTNLDRISKTTKEFLERRRTWRLDPNTSHIERNTKENETIDVPQRPPRLQYSDSSPAERRRLIIPTGEAPPQILPSEVRVAIKSMKPGTAPRPDFTSADFLRAGGHPRHVILAAHMTSYLQKESIPDQWKTSRIVLIHKKDDREDLRNYRPICLLSVLYKVFTEIILMRISRTLDEAQPQERSGFRQEFGCLDHI